MKMDFCLRNETKTCYRFEHKGANDSFVTLYLKKADVDEAGINPINGICVTIEEAPHAAG